MTVSDPIADILLGIIAAVLCLMAWHDLRGSVSLHRVMTNLTDSTQHASGRAEQLADAIATLPRRIAQQFPHAADAKVVPDTELAPKPAPTVTTEQLGAGMVPPVAPHAYDPARMELVEAKLAALRNEMRPAVPEPVVPTIWLNNDGQMIAPPPTPAPAAQPIQLQTEPGATVAAAPVAA